MLDYIFLIFLTSFKVNYFLLGALKVDHQKVSVSEAGRLLEKIN